MQSSYNAPAPGRYTPPAVTPNAPYGAPAGIPPVPKKKKADGKLILILALVFAVLIAAVILIFCLTRTQKTGSADDILQSFMQEDISYEEARAAIEGLFSDGTLTADEKAAAKEKLVSLNSSMEAYREGAECKDRQDYAGAAIAFAAVTDPDCPSFAAAKESAAECERLYVMETLAGVNDQLLINEDYEKALWLLELALKNFPLNEDLMKRRIAVQEAYNNYLQNDAPGDTADSASEYNEPVYEEDEPAVYDSWEDAPGDRLYRPSSGYFVDQYSMYAFCVDTAVQDYVKLRMGPSKEHFNVVGQISNNTVVTVQTEDVDGWTLCYANGMEGWIRSDFLFDEYHVE